MTRYFFTFSLILAAALSRLLPHPPNVAPITALALFGGVYLDKKHAFLVPLGALLVSDYFLGFYSGMAWVYASFAGIGCLGLWLRKHLNIGTALGASVAGSVLFFILTNFGVWISARMLYPLTFAGLLECYTLAIPFFRNTLLGDMAYVGCLFGAYELARKFLPALTARSTTLEA
jgi:hypothetical protein